MASMLQANPVSSSSISMSEIFISNGAQRNLKLTGSMHSAFSKSFKFTFTFRTSSQNKGRRSQIRSRQRTFATETSSTEKFSVFSPTRLSKTSFSPKTCAVAAEFAEEEVLLSEDEAELADRPLRVKEGGGREKKGGGGRRRKSVSNAEKRIESDQSRLEWLKQEGIDLTSEKTIWRVNRVISRCTSVREAVGVVEEMKHLGLNMANEGTYLALITVCRRQRQGERALVVYEAMKEAGVSPGPLTFNALIACCQQAQRVEAAFRIKSDMEKAGLRPDVVTYTALMALVVKAGPYRGRSSPTQRLEKALALFEEMQRSRVPPDAIAFNTLLYAASQARLPGKVLEVYGMMTSAGVPPNQFTFELLLEAVGRGGRLKAAVEVLNEMKAAGVAPGKDTYNFLIEACGTAAQPDPAKAWELFEEMRTLKGAAPGADTFDNLITACCKGGDHSGALRAFEEMRVCGFEKCATASTFNRLIHSAHAKEGLEAAFEMYGRMRHAGLSADVVTCGTLIAACGREGDLGRAIGVREEMEGRGIRANQAIYHAFMGAYGQAGQWEDAIRTLRDMQRNCPDEPAGLTSYTIAFDACFGPMGADGLVTSTVETGGKLDITPGIRAAIDLYKEGVESGVFKNFSENTLDRCDVRNMTRAAAVVCVLTWLEAVRSREARSDLVLVTGTDKGRGIGEVKKGRLPKLFTCADRTFQSVGLKAKSLRTLTMQALTVEREHLNAWLAGRH